MTGFNFWKAIDSVSPSCKFQLKSVLSSEMAAFFIYFFVYFVRVMTVCLDKILMTSLRYKLWGQNLDIICKRICSFSSLLISSICQRDKY